MTNEEIIAAGVDCHKTIDALVTKLVVQTRRLEDLSRRGASSSLAKPLKAKKMIRMAEVLSGKASEVGYFAAEMHEIHTAIAKAAGIDAGSLTVVAGVDLPSISVMGGGDR